MFVPRSGLEGAISLGRLGSLGWKGVVGAEIWMPGVLAATEGCSLLGPLT